MEGNPEAIQNLKQAENLADELNKNRKPTVLQVTQPEKYPIVKDTGMDLLQEEATLFDEAIEEVKNYDEAQKKECRERLAFLKEMLLKKFNPDNVVEIKKQIKLGNESAARKLSLDEFSTWKDKDSVFSWGAYGTVIEVNKYQRLVDAINQVESQQV